VTAKPYDWYADLDALVALEKGWDSYRADPPSRWAFCAATRLAAAAQNAGAPLTRLRPSVVGGIGLAFETWEGTDRVEAANVYVEIRNTETVHAMWCRDALATDKNAVDDVLIEAVEATDSGFADLVERIVKFFADNDHWRTRVTDLQEWLDYVALRRNQFPDTPGDDGSHTKARHDVAVSGRLVSLGKTLAEFPYAVVVFAVNEDHDALAAATWERLGPRQGPCDDYRTAVRPCPFTRAVRLAPDTGGEDDDCGGAHTHADGAWASVTFGKVDYDAFIEAYCFKKYEDAEAFRAFAPGYDVTFWEKEQNSGRPVEVPPG
jgi:hypothetical protein